MKGTNLQPDIGFAVRPREGDPGVVAEPTTKASPSSEPKVLEIPAGSLKQVLDAAPLSAGDRTQIAKLLKGQANPTPSQLKAVWLVLSRLLVDAIDSIEASDDLARALRLAEAHATLLPPGKGDKAVIGALERRLGNSDPLWGSAHNAALLVQILDLERHARSKELSQLIGRLIAGGFDESAAVFLEFSLKNQPLAPGFFKPVVLMKDGVVRDRLLATHFADLHESSEDIEVACALAGRLCTIGRFAEAADLYELRLAPHSADPRVADVAANVLFWNDRFTEAVAIAARAASSPSHSPEARGSLLKTMARCLVALGDSKSALEALETRRQLLNEQGRDANDVWVEIGAGRLSDAFDAYWSSGVLEPLKALGRPLVSRDALERAFRSGTPIPGECAVIPIMGLGDEVRFAQMLGEMGALFERLTLFCDARLAKTFARSAGKVVVRPVDLEKPAPNIAPPLATRLDSDAVAHIAGCDHVADLRQFPAILRNRLDRFPASGHHLEPDEAVRAKWARRFADLPGTPVGLFWRSDIKSHTARHKQTELSDWIAALGALPISIVPLQYGLRDDEIRSIASDPLFAPLPETLDLKRDVEELFGLLAALPATIALPGSTQHMAGAVGAKVICPAHPFEAAWRRRPGSNSEIWAPSVEVVCGRPEQGLKGSMDIAVERLKAWLVAQAGAAAGPSR